tara:strand:- start:154 stop:525 length:372 start_codon:yes stop_codon:yes gene_type:complete
MKQKSSNKRYYSAYIFTIYLFIIGVFNYFYSTYFFFLEDFPSAHDSSRSAFLIGSAFLIFQIYNIDKEFYKRLIDTFIVMAFTLTMVYPTFCVLGVFIFSPVYILFIIIHFLIIGALLYDKNK